MNQKCMRVLLVYKQIEMQFDKNGDLIVPDDYKLTITVSYNEKSDIQTISNTAPDLRPTRNTEKYIVMQNTNVWERSLYWLALIYSLEKQIR